MSHLQKVLDQLKDYEKTHRPVSCTRLRLLQLIRKWAIAKKYEELENYCQNLIYLKTARK